MKHNYKCSVEKRDCMQLTYDERGNDKTIDFYIVGGDSSVLLGEKDLKDIYEIIGKVLRR